VARQSHTEAIGDAWISDFAQLRKILPLAADAAFRHDFRQAKRHAKARLANWLKATSGHTIDPDTIFDCQIKRIHEYKRQLLNVLHIIVLYQRLRANPKRDVTPRTFLLGGKPAPAYTLAKLSIKFINSVGAPSMPTGRAEGISTSSFCQTTM
jgi:starch phosphorylase